ncbi:poly-gamma-glutamate biosynthesis protein-like protein [Leptotrichia trevisanii]|uniref:Poly-gamma-glutamate biosynthesis protein-like protein n=1 Tax=Leptotrichia trevisanii TaxID=109328 RepID=A0A510KN32_9FUSO|nr:CapA family protein [Leptotrichia trevisanii]BBM53120.1 poly-gamma-glutamate biosynthesis protein-like protein [Leptotrichia trevisanii]
MKKNILLILFAILISLLAIITINPNFKGFKNKFTNFEKIASTKKSDTPKNDKPNEKTEFTIIGVGDIMLGSNYPFEYLLPKNDANILENTQNILKNADITVGNLEGTLFDNDGTPKSCNNPNVCYVFRMPSRYGTYLKQAGFDYLSIANNHSNDFGEIGIKKTMKNLDNLGIKYSGIKDIAESAILEKDGKKFGFISFSPNLVTVKLNDYNYAKKLISELKSKVDIVIVMFHGGSEGTGAEHITRKNEIFHGEDRGNVYEFAHFAIDNGADIIFGQGPHVTRAVELYKNKFISYSAGNFATFGKINISGSMGLAPIFKIKIDSNGNFISGEIIPIRQTYESLGPFIDSEKSVIKKIISLNKSDFPNGNGLSITADGKITKINNLN